jgi:hypothetical protein
LTLGSFGHEAGLIDVTNTGASDVHVGLLANQSGTTRIDSALGGLEALDPTQLLRARDIEVAVGGGVGSSSAAIATDLRSGAIAATAGGDVHLTEVDGDMGVDAIVTSGDVHLRAMGSILDANGDTLANVVGHDVYLLSEQGRRQCGQCARHRYRRRGGRLTAAAGGDLHVDEVVGDLRLVTAESALGSVGLSARTGNLQLGRVTALAGSATLTAAGGILDGDDAVDIDAGSIALQAGSGSIGTPADLLEVDSGGLTGDVVSALAALGIHLRETSGDLAVGQIHSTGGDVLLLA